MGVVYEAWDPDLGRTIALKVVAPAFSVPGSPREAYERRFLSEAKAAARLSHPGIVVVHDVGRDRATGHVYMALEYLTGATLQDRLAEGPLPWREALRIVGRVADALHHAHSKGVVHRDIKPANIMILPSGEPKILDFGIARVDTGHLTMPGEMFGTPLFMAPEQALGGTVDARSDLFSLGGVAYAVLCGRPAFEASSVPAIVARITHRDARPPSEVIPGLPGDIDYLLARAMAKSPEDRYADVRMFADDVEDVLAERPPRHRSGWTLPEAAGRTMVSVGAAGAELPELELVGASVPPRPGERGRRGHGRGRLLLFAALVGVAAAYFHLHRSDLEFWRRELPRLAAAARAYTDQVAVVPPQQEAPARVGSEPTPGPPATLAQPAAEPTATPLVMAPPPDGAEASLEAAGPIVEAAGSAPSPSVTPPAASPAAAPPLPDASPSAAPRVVPKRVVTPSAASQLVLAVEHQTGAGTLEVWVDGTRVFHDKLSTRVRRQPAFGVEPGRHQIEVRLTSGRSSRSARTSGTFRAGKTRRLAIAVLRDRTPVLEWR